MGTLHEVYQLKPRVLNSGSILKVSKEKANSFLEKYPASKNVYNEARGFSQDTFIINSTDGKIERFAMYTTERIIDCGEPGIYLSVQDGSKHGFINFEKFLEELTPYLDDALFYVIWDHIISRYEIKKGKFLFETKTNYADWGYDFEEYLFANYAYSGQLIADYYIEKCNEMMLHHLEIINDGDDLKERYYEEEEYENLLQRLHDYKKFISQEKLGELEEWLRLQLVG
ncbi:hypothetical protein HYN59_13270 [Flavobacterium album]|uniref:Uncharacterized protein n=1 Tax=Flavobacterium album TaxID=2175091 RepID=A0A2S1R0D6_9FLAO|nr:hypothetical protein [Flavobacterium album]AWH86019.1 hypothetical protein HYN59_13270 [Flavobacterium album]